MCALIYGLVFTTDIFIKDVPSVDYSDRLPVNDFQKVDYGKVNKYYQELFYMKYCLGVVENWKVVSEGESGYALFTEYYMKGSVNEVTSNAQKLIDVDDAESFVIFESAVYQYLLTIKEQRGPGTQYSDIRVKLYRHDDGTGYNLIYDKTDRFSRAPGYESNFFLDRIRLFVYKIYSGDSRYN